MLTELPAARMSAAHSLAAFATGLSFADLPDAVVEKAKLLLLDTIGVCLLAADHAVSGDVARYLKNAAVTGEGIIIGATARTQVAFAAFANGTLAHGQDYDDTHTETILHTSSVVVPVVLALGERLGVSGAEALTALVVGVEGMVRVARPAKRNFSRRGYQATAVAGTFGAILAAARLQRLNAAQATSALGLGGSVLSLGLMECVATGASAKQIHPGWTAFCGISAVDLACAGFSGPASIIEGQFGIYNSLLMGDIEPAGGSDDLGMMWETLNVRPKLYPCGHPIHAAIECAAAFRATWPKRIADIASITCELAEASYQTVCLPRERKIAPATGYEARFSLPFGVAVMLECGAAGIAQYTDDMAQSPVLRALMERIECRPQPSFRQADMPGRLTVRLTDGSVWQHAVPQIRGNAANPISAEEVIAKYQQNASAFGARQTQAILDSVMHLEQIDDLARLTRLLARA